MPGKSKDPRVRSVLASLEQRATQHDFDNLERFGITTDKAFGVSMANLKKIAKPLGRDHALALGLWDTGWYEARMLTAFVDDPEQVGSTQMDRWCRDFDNWGICDTLCFHLFDRTPHAWAKVDEWSRKRDEFGKRAAFALLASLAGHDRDADDEAFLAGLVLIEREAGDERNFVKKGVNWALRRIGSRNPTLHAAALDLSKKLAGSPDATARWIGRGAQRELEKPASRKRAKV
jgi:3-methyladenine DNA glycosylase AlkD